jgi:hypothetical protein
MPNTKMIVDAASAIMLVTGEAVGVAAYRVFARKKRQYVRFQRMSDL